MVALTPNHHSWCHAIANRFTLSSAQSECFLNRWNWTGYWRRFAGNRCSYKSKNWRSLKTVAKLHSRHSVYIWPFSSRSSYRSPVIMVRHYRSWRSQTY